MERKFEVGGFVDEYVLEIPNAGLPFEGEFNVWGEYKILSFEKIWNKIHVFIYFPKEDSAEKKFHIIKLFVMNRGGDVPERYEYVCSGQDIVGVLVGSKHKLMHLFATEVNCGR